MRRVSNVQPKMGNCMCDVVLRFAKSACRLALARKSSHNPTTQNMPLIAVSPKMAARSEHALSSSGVADGKIKSHGVPSRTSQWYACQYHRTCRSSLYPNVSWLTPQCFGEGRLTSGGGRLAGVDVADDDDVDVNLFLTAGRVSFFDRSRWRARAAPRGAIEGAAASQGGGDKTYPMVAVVCCVEGSEEKLLNTQIYSARCKV
jgi:hypothetical protein